jgi:hypothetical protein
MTWTSLKNISSFFLITLAAISAQAFNAEIGANYVYKNDFVDQYNNLQTQGITGSVTLYFWERIALELSYTDSTMINKEQAVSATSPSVITSIEHDTIYGTDLIFMFADHKSTLQPYIKGGVGWITKNQTEQIDNNPPWTIGPYSGWAPDYGVGLKIMLGESLAIRMGYDVQVTPINNNATAQNINGRAGLSWML